MLFGSKRFYRFCIVGSMVALADFALIWVLVHAVPRLVAVAIAYLLAVALHFWLNRTWVFGRGRVAQSLAGQLPRYLVVVGVCWICTVGVAALSLATLTANV